MSSRHKLLRLGCLQSTTGLYVFWAFYVVIVGALVVNYFRGNKEWL